ncbi:MaoC family dehydratase [Chromobacterium sphagni]|uniref:Dehydratase n=1 Tax=Chromobacterium sphagni TaxID=1903179 RepID=A0A1S1WWM1_9NEIS|nr:MaoC family dehydratase [Chromobacterium sphagni]OHX11527.1 dehydratase [Chromobacterium sphagni]OHX19787.1 dehydratase [Chromobacterium sphagni]
MIYFEDLQSGQRFFSPTHTLEKEEIIAFARQFDPQPFHTDSEAAKDTFFNGLAASGWHTSSLSMRLVGGSELGQAANGLIGMQIDKMRWPQPSRPGDTLQVEVEILEKRRSASQPGFGVVKARWLTRNQRGETAMQLECALWLQCRDNQDLPEVEAPPADTQ